ncbi:MAG TPA: cupin domain-containing protein [Acidobacteriota bacterium]|nr:cupin domain-containing protein [Acidobacteriota bacterium]
MAFIQLNEFRNREIFPEVRIRAPHLKNLMLSYVELDPGAVVPLHQHPHEQGGMVVKGKLRFRIGNQTQTLGPGSLYLIPSNVPHEVTVIEGPAVALDVFAPVREEYAYENEQIIDEET